MSKFEVTYPVSIPAAAISEVVRMVRGGTILSEKSLAGLAAYNVQGYLQSKLAGNPDVIGSAPAVVAKAAATLPPLTDEEACLHLEALASPGEDGAVKALPPFVVELLLGYLKQLFEKLLTG